jgi:hypothetical protein
MEYSVGNITVAISWSDYFTGLLESGGLSLPQWVQMDFLSASRFDDATALMQSGKEYVNLSPALQDAYTAWTTSSYWIVSFCCRPSRIVDYRFNHGIDLPWDERVS